MTPTSSMGLLLLAAPPVLISLTALLVLVLDLSLLRAASLSTRWVATTGSACAGCALALAVLVSVPMQGSLAEGMLVVTPLTALVQGALLALCILVLLLAASARFTPHAGEYSALILFATAAMMLLVSTQNLLVLFIAIEFVSLSLYLLTAFDKQSQPSAEAGLKYFLFGGVSAGMLLFGLSLLYGFSGSLVLTEIAATVNRTPGDPLLAVAMVLLLAGFGFKVAAAPFHWWAPEVYQGAPTASAALIAGASKVAGLFAFFVVFYVALPGAGWTRLIAVVAAVSMIWGNVAAIAQTSMRRLLAYSAVGHAGYMLIALAAHSRQSMAAVVYYVITYALATVGSFAVLNALGGEDGIDDFAGLAQRAPGLSFCLMIFLLSLAGVPPLAGFFGKFYVFVTALGRADHLHLLWLVLLALATSVVSFYYYLKVLKQVYIAEPVRGPVQVAVSTKIAVLAAALLTVLLGCLPSLLLNRIAAAVGL